MNKKKKGFEDFDSEEDKIYQNRLLIGILEVILEQKGKLEPDDVPRAYDQCRALIQQDIEFLAKKSCIYLNSEDPSMDPSKCCLMQLVDGENLQRDAAELVRRMRPAVWLLVYNQPTDKRLLIRDHLRIFFKVRSQVDIPSGDISTFPGLFLVLRGEMSAIDEEMFGTYSKLTPRFEFLLEFLLREVGPKIALKLKKYYEHTSLGYPECKFCNGRWVQQEAKEPDITNLSDLPCFSRPQELEKFLALSFRRMFYKELLNFINENLIMIDFSEEGFENDVD